VTKGTYDANNNLSTIEDADSVAAPSNKRTVYAYDAANRKTEERFPTSSTTTPTRNDKRSYVYDLSQHLREGLPAGQTVSGQSVLVRFCLDSPNRLPSRKQEAQASRWAHELDHKLYDRRSMSVPVGFLFRAQPETGSYDVTFRGADARKLTHVIGSAVDAAEWQGNFKIIEKWSKAVASAL